MIWLLAVAVWMSLALGLYLALSRDVLRCVLGLAVLGAGANLVLFSAGRIGPTQPPVVPLGESVLAQAANPLPQALVLTAIVIGFALVCFSLVLVLRLIERARTDDALALREAEPEPADPVKPPLPTREADVRAGGAA
ncbi:MAG: sodium:proton antiporter [Caldimonas sp.]|uniref:sodium:proton antiporter n=1 Tax=Caldimonas sp. TaxID=2838790 RepID=UPI0039194BCB